MDKKTFFQISIFLIILTILIFGLPLKQRFGDSRFQFFKEKIYYLLKINLIKDPKILFVSKEALIKYATPYFLIISLALLNLIYLTKVNLNNGKNF